MLNLDEPNNSPGTCPAPAEGRRSKKKKKRSRRQDTPQEAVRPDAVPQTQTRRRRGTQSGDPRTQGPPDGRQHSSNTTSSSRQEKMYMDRLRDLVPQLPKHGKMAQSDLIQKTIDYICDLQHTLENHPRLQGLDPRVIAAPGNALPPMQMQQLLLQQRKQERLIQQQQQQRWQQQQQQRYQQLQLQQWDQYPERESYQHREHNQQLEQFQQIAQYGELDEFEQRQPYSQPFQQQQQPTRLYSHLQHLQQHQLHENQQQISQHQQQQQQQQRDTLYPRRPLSTIASTGGRPTLQARRDAKLGLLATSLRLQRASSSGD